MNSFREFGGFRGEFVGRTPLPLRTNRRSLGGLKASSG